MARLIFEREITVNPFFEPVSESGIPAFDRIEFEHYREAFEKGFAEHDSEIKAIVDNPEPPTFLNTLEALERSGHQLKRVATVFFNLTSSDTTDELQSLELEIVPAYTAHHSRITSNAALFSRIRAVVEGEETLQAEQLQLLNETDKSFVRAGAKLSDNERHRVNDIGEELAGLVTVFGQNVLKDTNEYELVLENGEDLLGLPDFVLNAAMAEAEAKEKPGKYVFTISRSSITPFLQYAEKRELREEIYNAYTQCGANSTDNHAIIQKIVRLRAERARLLGFDTHGDYMLDDRMAKTPAAVTDLLDRVWKPCQKKVEEEAEDLQNMIQAEGGNFELEPWDWWYYTEKVRKARFDLDEELLKPYFKLENVCDGAFEVARRLYGISFRRRDDLPVYHPDVVAYEAIEADGSLIGYFLFDFYMRQSKRGGAWMSTFRDQSNLGDSIKPVIINCCNFPKSDPCLLGMEEVRTLFHEFGHGLHGLLSDVRYESLSGTNVKQDFVELPSQIMEHWAVEPEVLKSYARHIDSDKPIPDDLIEKIKATETFNQGFATTEYLAACYLDLAWHGADGESAEDVKDFEASAMEKIEKIRIVDPRYKSSYFQHIFTGDHYSAGYYVYMWAEVLDADGYEAFKENGLFDEATARSFRENILEKGGTVDPMTLYKTFRGREPAVEPLLNNRGLSS
ncbi:MAG: M3 family metallopeptidase [Gammaproteobacteria bacterium]|jgi:peptidyl-dipeptidase Dcp|nr:M3 family metallopeptidase [Gammaproteobacteria bacterium]MBT4493747.1 M3 family metallopeptidase [Gammaproteobacteria bacterium]